MIISAQMSINGFIEEMKTDFIIEINNLIVELHPNMASFAGVLVLIFIVYKVVLFMVNPEKGLDPYVVIRPCLILVGIVLYDKLVKLFMITPIDLLTDIIRSAIKKTSTYKEHGFNFEEYFSKVMKYTDPNLFEITEILPFFEILHLLIYFIASFVASYMLIKQAITIAIYYIMGYFSLIFSLIPGNEKSFYNWSLSFLALLLWGPFIVILKYIVILTKIDQVDFTSFFVILLVQIATIFIFLKVPQFCDFLISSGSGQASPHSGGGIGSMVRMFKAAKGMQSLKEFMSKAKKDKE
jgi:hypothetical protein